MAIKTSQLIAPKHGPRCAECPLHDKGIPVRDYEPPGEEWCGVSLIGEMPGPKEVQPQARVPMVGPTGRLARLIFAAIGADFDDAHRANAIMCGLRQGAKPSEARMNQAAECCRPLVEHNLRALGTTCVVCLGAVPLKAMMGYVGIGKYAGTVLPPSNPEIESSERPWWTTATFHPAFLLRDNYTFFEPVAFHIKKAIELACGDRGLWEPEIGDALDTHRFASALRRVWKEEIPIAVDVETDGLDPLSCGLLTVGVSFRLDGETKAYSWPFPEAYPELDADPRGRISKILTRILSSHQSKIFHNKQFDVPVLSRYFGGLCGTLDDTMIMHHVTYPETPHKLQQVAAQFLAVEPWKSDYQDSEESIFSVVKGGGWDEEKELRQLEELLWYNALDSAATLDLYYILKDDLHQSGLWHVYEADRKLTDLTIDWRRDGIGIDLELLEKFRSEEEDRVEELAHDLKRLCQLPSWDEIAPEIEEAERVVNAAHDESRRYQRVSTLLRKHDEETLRAKLDRARASLDLLHSKGADPDKVRRKERDLSDLSTALESLSQGYNHEALTRKSKEARDHAKELRVLLVKLRKTPCLESFNPRSDNHLLAVLENRRVIPSKVTEKRRDDRGLPLPSTSKSSLWPCRDDEFVNTLFIYRKHEKLCSTYLRSLHKKVGEDIRLHPEWKLHSTPTGRFGTEPAVQNWPKKMRQLFVAAPGCKIVQADYSQLELRIVAALADESDWLEAFRNGEDLHAMLAHKYFPHDFPQLDAEWQAVEGPKEGKDAAVPRRAELRSRGKNVTFGDIYLAGAETLYEQIRDKLDDVRTAEDQRKLRREVAVLQSRLRAATPNRMEWAAIQHRKAEENGFLQLPDEGRIRKWVMGRAYGVSPNQAANFPIQGMAAQVVNAATLRLADKLKALGLYRDGVWIILQTHDELTLEVEDVRHGDTTLPEFMAQLLSDVLYTRLSVVSEVTGRRVELDLTAESEILTRVKEE